eukprot:g68374.t1
MWVPDAPKKEASRARRTLEFLGVSPAQSAQEYSEGHLQTEELNASQTARPVTQPDMEDELIDIEAEFDRFFSEAPMEANNPFTSSPEQPAMRLMKPVPPGPCKLKATLQPAMRLMKPEPPAPCKLKGTPRSRLPFRRTCSRQLSFFDNAAQESGQLGSDFQGTPDLQLVTLRFGCTRGVCRGGLQPARSQAQDPLRSAAGEPRGRHPVQADSEAEGAAHMHHAQPSPATPKATRHKPDRCSAAIWASCVVNVLTHTLKRVEKLSLHREQVSSPSHAREVWTIDLYRWARRS